MSDVLLEALSTLRAALHNFDRQAAPSFVDPIERLKPLAAVVQSLGYEGPVKPRDCPKEYREQWRDFVSGRRTDLEPRAVRFLCWQVEIATQPQFHDFLHKSESALSARALQGLVASAHQRWSSELIDGPVGMSLRKLLRTYTGQNQRVLEWRRDTKIVAGNKGPAILGERLLQEMRPVEEVANRLGLIEYSAFMRCALEAATSACGKRLIAGSPLVGFLADQLLRWNGWEEKHFKKQIADWVLSQQTARLEDLCEAIKRLVLDKLGDPRLPVNAGRWAGMRTEATAEILKWLSRDDIAFFFEHVLPRGSDPHGRKDFWLKYVGRVRRSRPLLCPDDEYRLRTLTRQNLQNVGHYGKIAGTSSAFLLDFGEILVVEFSAYGNACYVYERKETVKVVPEFWKTPPFSRNALRVKDVGGRLAHQTSWKDSMSNFLAGYGIRPGV